MRLGKGNQSVERGAFDDHPEAVMERNDNFDLHRFEPVVEINGAVRILKPGFLFARIERENFR